ncbi:MAG: replication-associated recombination protein A [Bacteroidales bacterium]|nr:replication-associated recombination protein A [Bacteroidales bacterium]
MSNQPLAERLRPRTLEGYVGQEHLVGKGSVLRKIIESGNLPSFILWGPPGVGKTTLAKIIANTLERPFYTLSAVSSGVKDVREAIKKAKSQAFFSKPNPILFIDEIHRFSKSQQDSLLAAVEDGTITLIGATTENPSFEVISPLLSRCRVYVLKPLDISDLEKLLRNALKNETELKKKKIKIEETHALFLHSGGDARKLYNIIELTVNYFSDKEEIIINDKNIIAGLQTETATYDKNGEMHYDIISAFIKSVRGSDPNAAVYWLARMIEGGEDVKFIARRLIILAAEDIGLANPNALLIANNCFSAVNVIGYPESRIILSEATIYLANSPKSNSAYKAIDKAQDLVRKTGNLSVPLHLRNAPTKLMKELGYGKNYKYAHSYDENFVKQEYLPEKLSGKKLYEAQNNSAEEKTKQLMQKRWGNKYE